MEHDSQNAGRVIPEDAQASDGTPANASWKTQGVQGGRFPRAGWTKEGGTQSEDLSLTHECDVCKLTTSVKKFPTVSNQPWRLSVHRACNSDRLAASGKSIRDRSDMAN